MQQDTIWFWAIDWSATGAMLGGIGTILATCVILYSALQAKNSFKEWKQKQAYSDRRKVAIEILSTFYEVRQRIDEIRSPASFGNESDDAFEDFEIPEAERKVGGNKFSAVICLYRINKNTEFFKSLFSLMPKARAFFGADKVEAINAVFHVRADVMVAAQMLYRQHPDDNDEETLKRVFLYQAKIWKGTHAIAELDADPIDSQLEDIQNRLEADLLKYIREEAF